MILLGNIKFLNLIINYISILYNTYVFLLLSIGHSQIYQIIDSIRNIITEYVNNKGIKYQDKI